MTGHEHNRTTAARPTAFLSYAREDQSTAAPLARALEAAGVDVWWDTKIEGGAAFSQAIQVALESSDAVIVLWSRASIGSDWVLDEAATGRQLKKLVPVSLDGTEPPLGFRQYQAITLAGWHGTAEADQVAAIVRSVRAAAGHALHHLPHAASAQAAPDRMSRRRLLVGATGAALAGAAGWLAWRRGVLGVRAASGNTVAVLPFANLSGDPQQDYFSDGLAEEVRATLARNLNLMVMAEASSAQFRDRSDDAVTIAAKLGVAYLLDGTVRRSGELLRITADLVDGATGFSRWSQTFDRGVRNVFAVQSEIADAVTNALVVRVAPGSVPAAGGGSVAASGGTTSVIAYDAYLRGRALYDLSVDEASERAALAQFDAAIAADPNYAAAHAARARSLTAIANQYGKASELTQLYDAAIAAAQRAIAIAPLLADAHSTLGFTLFQGRLDARAAREPFERSREVGAGEATVLARYAQYSARTGRDAQATEAMQRALVLDKLNPLIHRAAGSVEYAARRYPRSIPPLQQALSMNPRLSRAHAAIGDAWLQLGRVEDARTESSAEPALEFQRAGLAIAEHRLGRLPAAKAAMSQLVAEDGDRVLYQQAQVLAQWGDRDAALERLEHALGVGDSGLIYARNDPLLDPLRDHARFARLLHRLGFA